MSINMTIHKWDEIKHKMSPERRKRLDAEVQKASHSMAPKEISYAELPEQAKNLISEEQKSYLDEFSFLQSEDGNIAAWYAGEVLAVWNGSGWQEPYGSFEG